MKILSVQYSFLLKIKIGSQRKQTMKHNNKGKSENKTNLFLSPSVKKEIKPKPKRTCNI